MSITAIATILLIARLISVFFIVRVLLVQYRLFGTKIDFKLVPNLTKMQRKHIYLMRRILFALSITILLGNFIPIVIDIVTILADGSIGRPSQLRPISVAYGLSNAGTAMFSAIMIWILYQVAGLGSDKDK